MFDLSDKEGSKARTRVKMMVMVTVHMTILFREVPVFLPNSSLIYPNKKLKRKNMEGLL